jgi:Zn-dependent protease with chaperone function
MSTQFFERQETQKAYTRWLVLGFAAAILVVVAVINVVVIVGLGGDLGEIWRRAPGFLLGTSAVVLCIILGASWYKSMKLKAGGAAVARALGGVPVADNETDLKRKRLLNIVEEMAIAARIRKPQVFVLEGEAGINAFAAGHSADEAAVAVTQGALDKFDRDQLQAVIGHEFSHILNGDMRINMRLTAWIFGLFVITDLARRIMRGRSRGKGAARIKLVAFGVFLAGSVGMLAGRLLQAAVSRRREHLADASAVQFTRNPQALQGAFIVMAAHAEGTRLEHEGSADVAHMFFAGADVSWMNKFGGRWLSTHPPVEERVRAIDSRVTPSRFKSLVNDERRKLKAKAAIAASQAPQSSAPAPGAGASSATAAGTAAIPAMAMMAPADTVPAAPGRTPPASVPDSMTTSGLALVDTVETRKLSETLPPGVRKVGGRQLPPDVLRNRLSQEQQASITQYTARIESNPLAVEGSYVAALLAPEPAKWRTQLTRLAPVLGIELFKEVQVQIPAMAAMAAPARLPLLTDLLTLLDGLEPAHRKRLRGVARAFAPTVAPGDMLRYSLTRLLEKRLAKPRDEPPPVPLGERSQQVCELYATLAHCRFGAGKQGQNSYRAGLMGMLPPQKWLPFPESLLTLAALDAALAGVAQIHPTGRRSFSEGLARVIAVGGRLTVPQVDLLRGVCLIVDCQMPLIPVDVVFDENAAAARATRPVQASAR